VRYPAFTGYRMDIRYIPKTYLKITDISWPIYAGNVWIFSARLLQEDNPEGATGLSCWMGQSQNRKEYNLRQYHQKSSHVVWNIEIMPGKDFLGNETEEGLKWLAS